MPRKKVNLEESGDERFSKWKQAPNRRRPEAVAMRRIVVEMGFWLSPFMRDEPLPVLTEWERTVDLSRLANVNYLPVDPDEPGRQPKTPKARTGANHRTEQTARSLAEIRERQNAMNAKRNEKRKRKRA